MGGQVKGQNGINEGQDKTEGNVVCLLQHNYFESALHCYTCMTYTELLVFSMRVGEEGRRKYETQSFRNKC